MPSLTVKTLRGSSRLVSFSQVVRPARSLPLKSLIGVFGVIGSCAATALVRKAVSSRQRGNMMRVLLLDLVNGKRWRGEREEKSMSLYQGSAASEMMNGKVDCSALIS